MEGKWLDWAVELQALAQAGLHYGKDKFDLERYERIREIATIKVLGFYQGEVASYVFREINLLSVLGSLAGLAMGKGLHSFVMAQVKIDSMTFACRIAPLSYLISFAMTLLFTVVISTGMRPRLRKIDMAESLKSIE